MDVGILQRIESFPVIRLDQMEDMKLMNRNDSKFVTTAGNAAVLLDSIKDGYMVLSMEGCRCQSYVTTYLDDEEHTMYLRHHNGRLVRQKMRVRTYLDSGGLTFFEIKIKDNHGRTHKKRKRVESLETLAEDGCGDYIFQKAIYPVPLERLHPTLEVDFERVTLVNMARTERVTMDFELRFRNPETGISRDMDGLMIVEVKRSGRSCSQITDELLNLRVHPSGFSKYCIGSALTNDGLKQNRFKKKIRGVNKLLTI